MSGERAGIMALSRMMAAIWRIERRCAAPGVTSEARRQELERLHAAGGNCARRLLALFFMVSLGWLAVPRCAAQEEPTPLEYQVKAAFLLNFTKFVEWPPAAFSAPDAPIRICILGNDPFGRVLDHMAEGESVSGRSVAVERVKRPVPASCQVVFISESERNVKGTLANLKAGVLTVSDERDFVRDGGMIGLAIENRRVTFDINQSAMTKGGVKASSRLLTVARSVVK